MTDITDRMQKFESIIKKPIATSHKLFAGVAFSRINSFTYINSFVIPFIRANPIQFQKDCYQDNLLFACLQFFKHSCLNMFAGNICFHKQVKNREK